MCFQKSGGGFARRDSQPGFADKAECPRQSHHAKEHPYPCPECPGGGNEQFEGHGNRKQGGNEDGDQTVSLEPQSEPLRAARLLRLSEKPAAAPARGGEENRIAANGAQHRKQRGPIARGGIFHRDQNQQRVHPCGNRDTNRIDKRENEQTDRAKCHEGVDELVEQTAIVTRPFTMLRLCLAIFILAGVLAGQTTFPDEMAAARKALQQSRYPEAQMHLEAALKETIGFPPNDPRSADVFEALSQLNALQGDYSLAERYYRQALTIREAALGAESTDLTPYLTQLAAIFRAEGKPELAEPVLKRSLAIHEKALGATELPVAADLDQLAGIYQSMKRFPEGVDAYHRAFAIRARKLGLDHIDLATTLVNLGVLYSTGGKYGEAEQSYLEALRISEKNLGPENYGLIGVLDRLGLLYRDQNKYPQAEPMFQRSLAIREKLLGPWHSDVAPTLDNLAMTYYREKKYREAEPLYKRSLAIWEQTQGPDSAFVAVSLDNLASLYCAQQRFATAEPLYMRSLKIREKDSLTSLETLALLNDALNQPNKADLFYKRALLIGEQGMGGEHPEVAEIMETYAVLLRNLKRPAEASRVEAKAREIKSKSKQTTAANPPQAVPAKQ
jgi:tetratricopeptide (TPR) repeat protein